MGNIQKYDFIGLKNFPKTPKSSEFIKLRTTRLDNNGFITP